MEITIDDILYFKLSPSLIFLIKTIHSKNNKKLEELNKVADVFLMGKHLEDKGFVKIINSKVVHSSSFEIRQLATLKYLNKEVKNEAGKIDEVINYFIEVTRKTRTSTKASANRKFISARLKEYTVNELKGVIDLKYEQWNNDPNMKKYIRIATLFNEEKFQGYIGELESEGINKTTDFVDDI